MSTALTAPERTEPRNGPIRYRYCQWCSMRTGRRGEDRGLDPLQHVGVQGQLGGGEQVVELGLAAGADDGGGDSRLMEQPGDAELGRGRPELGGEGGQAVGDRKIALAEHR